MAPSPIDVYISVEPLELRKASTAADVVAGKVKTTKIHDYKMGVGISPH